MIDKKNFARRLEKLMDGMSNRYFAEKCGIEETNIRNYLAGKLPRPRTLPIEKICRACNVPLTWFDLDPFGTFTSRLRQILDENNWQPTDLAQVTGVPSRTINNWLYHDDSPKADEIKLLARKTGYQEEWLESGHGGKKEGIGDISVLEESSQYKRAIKAIEIEDDNLLKLQEWLNDMTEKKPTYKIWFALEIENRFPEFVEWQKKSNSGNHNDGPKKKAAG